MKTLAFLKKKYKFTMGNKGKFYGAWKGIAVGQAAF